VAVSADGRNRPGCHPAGQRSLHAMGMVFEHPVEVRWRDTDALGHINHVVFLTYLEEGRDAFYVQAVGGDTNYVVARLEIDYRAEIRHAHRRVLVRIEPEQLGTTSLTTRETVLAPDGEVAAAARVVTVRWDRRGRQPVPFSGAERARLGSAGTAQPAPGTR
jgi:acyl-CoA thioester hydrolase